jgi:hypothetical protein
MEGLQLVFNALPSAKMTCWPARKAWLYLASSLPLETQRNTPDTALISYRRMVSLLDRLCLVQ